jgi:protein TonB
MGAPIRNWVVFGTIVSLHAGAIYGLAQIKAQRQAPLVQQPIAVRMISLPQERAPAKPIEVKTISPRIAIAPPELPVIDVPIVEESVRAITIPARPAAPVASSSDRDTPKLVSNVEYIREPVPRYPPQSRKLREQGLVMLRVLIDEQGNACSIEIESSSGYARLDHAAREAVARAAFRPYVEDGEPRRAVVLIPIEFYLNRSPA